MSCSQMRQSRRTKTNKKTHRHTCRRAPCVSLSLWQCLHSTGCCPHQLLSVVTLGSGPHAFPFSSAQMKKILCILGALRWGNSAQHIRWQSGTFYAEEFLYSHTNIHTKTIFQPSFSRWYAASCPNVLPVPDQKACMCMILSKGDW